MSDWKTRRESAQKHLKGPCKACDEDLAYLEAFESTPDARRRKAEAEARLEEQLASLERTSR